MKKKQHFADHQWSGIKKLIIVMKLTAFFLLLSVMSIAAGTYGQETRFDLNVKDVTIVQLFDEIEHVTEFGFLFKTDQLDLNRHYTLDLKKANIDQILNEVLDKDQYNYTVIDRNIVITRVDVNAIQDGKSKTVSGKVTDSSGASLPGVTVVVKGTTAGVITDANGSYSLSNIPANATLQFSFVGMKTQEMKVDGKSTVNVKLEEETIGLDEVVAIGYGTVKKQNLTGSVAKIKNEALQERTITTLGEGLTGQIAGLRAREVSGAPGSELSISIRGINTVNASNAPLYILDGIAVGSMKDINPSDVASIEVLKDASSSAIYGARGANGVVLITTKQGNAAKPTFNFEASYGLQRIDKTYDVMNRDEYIAYASWAKNQAYLRSGGSMSDPMSKRPFIMQIPEAWSDPEKVPDTDWQGALYRIAPVQTYNLNVSGGSDIGTFLISGSYMKQDGIMIETDYTRATIRLNTVLNVANNIRIGMNIAPSMSELHPGDQQHMAAAFIPTIPLDGHTVKTGFTQGAIAWMNPVEELKQDKRRNSTNMVISNIWGEWNIIKSLTYKSQLGYNYSDSKGTSFLVSNVNNGAAASGAASISQANSYSFQNTLVYKPKISSLFDNELLLGQSIESNKYYLLSAAATGYPNELVETLNVASTKTGASTIESENRLSSFFGRLNFNVNDKYLVTLNLRRDGSSKFGADTKWGWFPSASAGWKINKERFLGNAKWIDLLKFRAMVGRAGNNSIGDYEHIASLAVANYNFSNKVVSGLYPSSIAKPDLGWETKNSRGLGLDFNAFDNRVQATLDYYNDMTSDMLLDANVSYMSGFGSIRQNLGKVQNRGWEIELTTDNIRKQVSWSTSFNFSRNRNEVKKLGVGDAPIIMYSFGYPTNITKVGEAIGSFYMYKTDGILLDKDFDVNGKPLVPILTGQEKGNLKVVDVNKDGKITPDDYTVVGNNMPDFMFGLTNTFKYKNFDLTFLFQGQVGAKIFFMDHRYIDYGQYQGINNLKHWLHSYKPESPNGENPYPTNTNVDLSWDGKTPMMRAFGISPYFCDYDLYDASYLRLKNVTIGYNIPKRVSQKMGIDQMRIYFNGDNLYTWTKYFGTSPEYNGSGSETISPGIDNSTYGVSRRYSIGVKLTF